jgi:apolipoprotein N-acyltransferase
VRSTNTGISAFIEADGTLLQKGKQFEPELMTMDVQPRRGATPYAIGGNWPVLGFCFAILGAFWIRNRPSL